MKKREEVNIEELFCGMPLLQSYFKAQERRMKDFSGTQDGEEKIKRWEKKRDEMLQTARELRAQDLEIVYYVKKIRKIKPERIRYVLKKLSDASDGLEDLDSED